MKKLLLASTALVASASFAQAEVAVSGSAEMGIYSADQLGFDAQDLDTLDVDNGDTQFFTDVDVTFTMTGESENGVSFGANVDLSDGIGIGGSAVDNNADDGEITTFVSFGGATLTMGDTDGALDARVPEMGLAGSSLADDETAHAGFDSGAALDGLEDGQIARFDYTYSSFTFSLSAEQDDNGAGEDPVLGVGVSYGGNVGGFTINAGLGFQRQNDANIAATVAGLLGNDDDDNFDLTDFTAGGGADDFAVAFLGAGATASDFDTDIEQTSLGMTAALSNGLTFGFTASATDYSYDGAETQRHYGVGVGYEMNALAVGINYGKYTDFLGLEDADKSGFGLAAAYDLGGGLSLNAGYGSSEFDLDGMDETVETFSLGARMTF